MFPWGEYEGDLGRQGFSNLVEGSCSYSPLCLFVWESESLNVTLQMPDTPFMSFP